MGRIFSSFLLLVGLGCSSGTETEAAQERTEAAPATPQAITIMEPPRFEIGETAVVDVAISVPPGSRVTALGVPEETPGLWVLDAVGPTVEQQAGRDVHRTRFRVRARATGTFAWPGSSILAFTPEGEEFRLTLAPRPFRVSTVSDEVPGKRTFFSYREPSALRSGGDGGNALVSGLIGALLAYASVALLVFVRRTRNASAAPVDAPTPAAPWRATQAALAAANEIAEEDPTRAADMASGALRHYIDGRFGTDTTRATTEELRRLAAPFLLTTRWEKLMAVLEGLDQERFPPVQQDRAAQTAALREVIARAQDWVSDAAPRGNVA